MEILQAPEGDVIAEHSATLANRIWSVLLLILPGLGLLFAATQLAPGDADARPPLLVIGAVLLALGGLAVVQQNKSRFVLRADGVERWGLRGKIWALRWSEMSELHYGVVKVRVGGLLGLLLPALSTNVHIKLTDPNGKKRRVPHNLKGMDVLAERITEQQTTAHFAAARARLDLGEEVRFGKVMALDKEKLSVRKLFGGMKSCPLLEIEKFTVQNGALRVRQRGKMMNFANIMTLQIPNVFLLLRLLDSLLGVKPPATGDNRDFAGEAHVVV
jgi:hypothetical protein